MLYVDGSINSLSGPSSGAAIANGSAMTIDAGNGNNMTITGNLTYATEPVTMTQNQIPGTPADTLIPGNNYGQVLGLFTAGGQIQMSFPQTIRTWKSTPRSPPLSPAEAEAWRTSETASTR